VRSTLARALPNVAHPDAAFEEYVYCIEHDSAQCTQRQCTVYTAALVWRHWKGGGSGAARRLRRVKPPTVTSSRVSLVMYFSHRPRPLAPQGFCQSPGAPPARAHLAAALAPPAAPACIRSTLESEGRFALPGTVTCRGRRTTALEVRSSPAHQRPGESRELKTALKPYLRYPVHSPQFDPPEGSYLS